MARIYHKRGDCIGCGLCPETAADYFFMDQDGLATLINGSHQEPFDVALAPLVDKDLLKEAERACPVNIIRIGG